MNIMHCLAPQANTLEDDTIDLVRPYVPGWMCMINVNLKSSQPILLIKYHIVDK